MASHVKPLESGEPIGVVALSGPVDAAKLAAGLEALRAWGHPVIEAPNLGSRSGYLAGTDEERVDGLLWVLDRGVRTVIAARGGYGVTRLLPLLPMKRLVASDVTFVGFSDLTALLNGAAPAGGAAQVHGPMVAAGLARPRNASRLRAVLTGELRGHTLFGFDDRQVVRSGRAAGRSVGGNLSMLSAAIGTPYEPRFEDSILFVEEVGEPYYRLDRLLTHLGGSGRLRGVKALIGGSLRGCGPISERARVWRELVSDLLYPGAPVVTGLRFGHGAVNLAFPIGARLEVDTGAGEIRWSA